MVMETVKEMIMRHEGFRDTPYLCPNGHLTIGYGHKITNKDDYVKGQRYSKKELEKQLDLDIANANFYTNMLIGEWELPQQAYDVVLQMIFQMGALGVTRFKKFLKALKAFNFGIARIEMLQSKWAKSDSPKRAKELADIIGKLQ